MGPFELQALTATQVLQALLVGVGVIALHLLLRPRPRSFAVASHVLWDRVLPKRTHPLWKEILLVVLQLMAFAALVVAWAEPRWIDEAAADVGVPEAPTQRIFVLDEGATMAAGTSSGSSRRALGAAQIEEQVKRLPGDVQFALVLVGRTATTAVPMGRDKALLSVALRHGGPEPVPADHAGAATRIADMPGLERARATVEWWSDDVSPEWIAAALGDGWALPPRLHRPFEPVANAAIEVFDLRASAGIPAEEEALLRVRNDGAAPAVVDVVLEDDKRRLGRATFEVPAMGTSARTFRFQPLQAPWIEARIVAARWSGAPAVGAAPPPSTTDAFAEDDRLWAWVEPVAPFEVALVGSRNRYLERVLSVLPTVRVHRIDAAAASTDGASYDAVFIDGPPLPGPPPPRAVFFGAAGAAVFGAGSEVREPVVTDWNHDHPVFTSLVLGDLRLARSLVLTPATGDVRLLGGPDGAFALARDDAERRWLAFGFDLAESDLPLRVAFPQWVVQCLLWMREARATPPPTAEALPGALGGPEGAVVVAGWPEAGPLDAEALLRPLWPSLVDVGGPAVVSAPPVRSAALRAEALVPSPPVPIPAPAPVSEEREDPVFVLLVAAVVLLLIEVWLWLR